MVRLASARLRSEHGSEASFDVMAHVGFGQPGSENEDRIASAQNETLHPLT